MKKSHVRLVKHLPGSDLTTTYCSCALPPREKKRCNGNGPENYLCLMQVIGNGRDEESISAGMMSGKNRKGTWNLNLQGSLSLRPGLPDTHWHQRTGLWIRPLHPNPRYPASLAAPRPPQSWRSTQGEQQTDAKGRAEWDSTWSNNESPSWTRLHDGG